jgi:hypothetical protein
LGEIAAECRKSFDQPVMLMAFLADANTARAVPRRSLIAHGET